MEAPVLSALTVAGFTFGEPVVARVDDPDDILGKPAILDACRDLGGEIARRADGEI